MNNCKRQPEIRNLKFEVRNFRVEISDLKFEIPGSGSSRPSGFTLVELMIAVLILALLTSAVALSFSVQVKEARARDSIEQLRSFDAASRQFAVRYSQGVKIIFDLSANSLARQRQGRSTPDALIFWPAGYRVDEIRVGGDYFANDEAPTVAISPMGIGPTYAVRLRGPDFDQWVLFAGLSGQITQVADESAMIALLSRAANANSKPR